MKDFEAKSFPPFQLMNGITLVNYLCNRSHVENGKRFVTIATHNGCFHADELLACAVIRHALRPYNVDIKVVRTRDIDKIRSADIAVDVGEGLFDHHTDDTMEFYPNGIQMAACGKVLREIETDPDMYNQLLNQLFYAVCAQDTGMELMDYPTGVLPSKLGYVPMYNPTWIESTGRHKIPGEEGELFMHMVDRVEEDYVRARCVSEAVLGARKAVAECNIRNGGKFIYLPTGSLPWIPYSYKYAKLYGAIYPDQDTPGHWVLRMAPVGPGSRELKHPFPSDWCGLSGGALSKAAGIDNLQFCHKAGFILIAKSVQAIEAVADYIGKEIDNNAK